MSYVQLTVDGGAIGALREEQQVGCETEFSFGHTEFKINELFKEVDRTP